MPKVSIIVPVFNAEKTLVKCVSCLIKQTLQDIEIILVNDCSTDNSLQILQLLEKQFPDKLIVINSDKNRGAGGARNIALQYATGEYLGFVDSDDEISLSMYEKLYSKAIEGDYDIVDCGFYNEACDLSIIYTSDELSGNLDVQKRKELIVSGGYLCTKIFKSDYWHKHSFNFRENAILEDSEIIALAMATAKNIGNVKEVLYIYKDTPNSSSKTMDTKWYVDNCYNAMNALYKTLSLLDYYNEIKEAVEYEILQMYSYSINMLLHNIKVANITFTLNELSRLQSFRNTYISPGYTSNYITSKITKEDILLMEQNDHSPQKLVDSIII